MNADDRGPQSYALIGAAMHVHRVLGYGFLKPVYQEALALLVDIELPEGVKLERGILLNFGTSRLEYKQLVLSQHHPQRLGTVAEAKGLSADDADLRR